jgi:DegV family protein with EDD domain
LSNVAIVTDSIASIPEPLIGELNIHWVPYYIHRGSEVLRDLVTIQRDEFYSWMKTATELPQTASPGPGDYYKKYTHLIQQGIKDIISIHMSSKGSGAYQAALAAKSMITESFPKIQIEVIDCLNVAMCQGWMAVEAARAALMGSSMSQIIQLIHEMIPKTKMIQTADTLKYLYMGGRIGRAKHLVASLLNIKPLISMENGEIVALGTAISRQRAYKAMANFIESRVGKMGKIKIAYVHAAAEEEVYKIKSLIEERVVCVESLISELSPALGVHSGPGTAGIAYFPIS